LAEDEERELEDELEQLIICMTDNIPEDQKEEDTDFDTIIEVMTEIRFLPVTYVATPLCRRNVASF
jgi:hypothetical protein